MNLPKTSLANYSINSDAPLYDEPDIPLPNYGSSTIASAERPTACNLNRFCDICVGSGREGSRSIEKRIGVACCMLGGGVVTGTIVTAFTASFASSAKIGVVIGGLGGLGLCGVGSVVWSLASGTYNCVTICDENY